MAKPIYTIEGDSKGGYWVEENGVAVTGDLWGYFPKNYLTEFVNAYNVLHEISEELPIKPKLPIVRNIKELVEKGLKRG